MKELLEKRAKAFEQARALVLKAESEARALTAEELVEYEARMADVKSLGDTIERSKLSSEMAAEFDRSIGPRETVKGQRGNGSSDLVDASLDTFLRSGVEGMTTEQRNVFGRVTGFRDSIQLRTASPLSSVTGAAGADTIPQGFVYTLETAMKWFGGMRQSRATVLRTATGNPLPWPTMSDTNNVGELISENTPVTQAVTEMSFGFIEFNGWKYSSKLVLVPIELIQDSAFDVQGFVAKALGQRVGRIQNTHFTVGTGSSQPNGLVTASTLGVTGATGETAKCTYPDLVNLIHSVDPAYRIGAEFMFNDSTASFLEQLVDGNGRPLLNSSLAGVNEAVRAGEPGVNTYTISGYKTIVNNDVASFAANAKSILFGDFSKYIIRDVMDLMLVRFSETYMASGQIGFLCFMRSDGDLIDAGTHPVRYFANSAT